MENEGMAVFCEESVSSLRQHFGCVIIPFNDRGLEEWDTGGGNYVSGNII